MRGTILLGSTGYNSIGYRCRYIICVKVAGNYLHLRRGAYDPAQSIFSKVSESGHTPYTLKYEAIDALYIRSLWEFFPPRTKTMSLLQPAAKRTLFWSLYDAQIYDMLMTIG